MTDQEKDYIVSALHDVPTAMSLPASSKEALQSLLFVLDPLRTYELSSYFKRLPLVAAGAYVVGVAIMVVARDFFPVAYVGLVIGAFVIPAAVAVVANGV
eukprot:CAMPEP_0118652916 /NCGR_PEP_ID=MMETSP0785-20121206/11566_1 /TAXON_ID=91992 /ORGANISM="Bolidomonas pacifica, Strain CCMP 1866" /LENGTH=99 /DNA_ID=CAMNT_0006545451 /DNA_START=67 /DNA_END=366 /DNA_ORIENTATION=+